MCVVVFAEPQNGFGSSHGLPNGPRNGRLGDTFWQLPAVSLRGVYMCPNRAPQTDGAFHLASLSSPRRVSTKIPPNTASRQYSPNTHQTILQDSPTFAQASNHPSAPLRRGSRGSGLPVWPSAASPARRSGWRRCPGRSHPALRRGICFWVGVGAETVRGQPRDPGWGTPTKTHIWCANVNGTTY